MTYLFSEKSLRRLSTCDRRLQDVFQEVIKHYDCSIIEGIRDEHTQNEYFRTGKSKLKFPESKHNKKPSKAIDVAPYPIDWDDAGRFRLFAGFVMGVAAMKGVKLRYGGDWDGDLTAKDQSFHDLPHFEILEDHET